MADYIITSLQSWDIEIGSTIKNTALEISKKNRVFYVSTPLGLKQWLKKRKELQRKKHVYNKNLQIIYCNIPALPVNSMPFKWLFNVMNFINNLSIAHTINKIISEHQIKDCIHLIDTDIFRSRYLKQLIHPTISIYYRRDYVIGVDYWKKYGVNCEQKLVQQSDIVITNSNYFTKELSHLNSHIYTTNTGVNIELYNARIHHPVPSDLLQISSPIIGYTGAVIERRLDSSLLYQIAQQLPEYSFVFVGPEDEHFKKHDLHQLKNVYFVGHREVNLLPQYIQHFDVCINPQCVNQITEGNYPLKIDEYLMMGKPIVATRTHTMCDVFSAHTHLAHDITTWLKALKSAVNEINDQSLSAKRIAFAHTHSWEHSIEVIYNAIEDYKKTKKEKE